MKTYDIEYTTNIEDRLTTFIEAENKTDAYLQFAFASPRHFTITDIKERK